MIMCKSVGRNIMIIDKYFRMYFKNNLRQYGLNTAEGLCLLHLYESDGQTQEQLISKLHFDKGVMARTMKSLEEKTMVQRSNHKDDNRSYVFHLTQKGFEQKPAIIGILKHWNTNLLSQIPREDIQKLEKQLEKLAESAANLDNM